MFTYSVIVETLKKMLKLRCPKDMLWHLKDVLITFLFLPSHVRTSTTCVLIQRAVSWFQQNQVSESHPHPNTAIGICLPKESTWKSTGGKMQSASWA